MAAPHGHLLHIDEREALALRRARLGPDRAEELAGKLRALGDPTRLGLALALCPDRELCVCDLSWVAQRAQSLVSHHMRILKSEGVVCSRREGKMTMYSLTDTGRNLVEAARGGLPEDPA
jgi:ArsR family transcriptional regulator, lead/cadmium/zinc/bismuth-responsive transcriptional repressor